MKFLLLRWSFFWGLWACSCVFNHCWQPGHCVFEQETEKKRHALFFYLFCMFAQCWWSDACVLYEEGASEKTNNSCINVWHLRICLWCVIFVCPPRAFFKFLYFPVMLTGDFWAVCLSLSRFLPSKSTAAHSCVSSVSQKAIQPYNLINLHFHFKTIYLFSSCLALQPIVSCTFIFTLSVLLVNVIYISLSLFYFKARLCNIWKKK